MIKVILNIIMVVLIMYFFISIVILKKAIKIIKSKDKSREQLYYNILNLWLENRNNKKTITEYLKQRNIKKISIYGCGELGRRLAEELLNDGYDNISFIDSKRLEFQYNELIVNSKTLNEFDFSEVEMIIITAIHQFDNIKMNLQNERIRCQIISLQQIVEDMFFDLR